MHRECLSSFVPFVSVFENEVQVYNSTLQPTLHVDGVKQRFVDISLCKMQERRVSAEARYNFLNAIVLRAQNASTATLNYYEYLITFGSGSFGDYSRIYNLQTRISNSNHFIHSFLSSGHQADETDYFVAYINSLDTRINAGVLFFSNEFNHTVSIDTSSSGYSGKFGCSAVFSIDSKLILAGSIVETGATGFQSLIVRFPLDFQQSTMDTAVSSFTTKPYFLVDKLSLNKLTDETYGYMGPKAADGTLLRNDQYHIVVISNAAKSNGCPWISVILGVPTDNYNYARHLANAYVANSIFAFLAVSPDLNNLGSMGQNTSYIHGIEIETFTETGCSAASTNSWGNFDSTNLKTVTMNQFILGKVCMDPKNATNPCELAGGVQLKDAAYNAIYAITTTHSNNPAGGQYEDGALSILPTDPYVAENHNTDTNVDGKYIIIQQNFNRTLDNAKVVLGNSMSFKYLPVASTTISLKMTHDTFTSNTMINCHGIAASLSAVSSPAPGTYLVQVPKHNKFVTIDPPMSVSCTDKTASKCSTCPVMTNVFMIQNWPISTSNLPNFVNDYYSIPLFHTPNGKYRMNTPSGFIGAYQFKLGAWQFLEESTMTLDLYYTYMVNMGAEYNYPGCVDFCLNTTVTPSQLVVGRIYRKQSSNTSGEAGTCYMAGKSCAATCLDNPATHTATGALIEVTCSRGQCNPVPTLTFNNNTQLKISRDNSDTTSTLIPMANFTALIDQSPTGNNLTGGLIYLYDQTTSNSFIYTGSEVTLKVDSTGVTVSASSVSSETTFSFSLVVFSTDCAKFDHKNTLWDGSLIHDRVQVWVPFEVDIYDCSGQSFTSTLTGPIYFNFTKNEGRVPFLPLELQMTYFATAVSDRCQINGVSFFKDGTLLASGNPIYDRLAPETWGPTTNFISTEIAQKELVLNFTMKLSTKSATIFKAVDFGVEIGCFGETSFAVSLNTSAIDVFKQQNVSIVQVNSSPLSIKIVVGPSSDPKIVQLNEVFIWTNSIPGCDKKNVTLCNDQTCLANSASQQVTLLSNPSLQDSSNFTTTPILYINRSTPLIQTKHIFSKASVLNATTRLTVIVCGNESISVNSSLSTIYINASSSVADEWIKLPEGHLNQSFILTNADPNVADTDCPIQHFSFCSDSTCDTRISETTNFRIQNGIPEIRRDGQTSSSTMYLGANTYGNKNATQTVLICAGTFASPVDTSGKLTVSHSQPDDTSEKEYTLSSLFNQDTLCPITDYSLLQNDLSTLTGAQSAIFKISNGKLVVTAPTAATIASITVKATVNDQMYSTLLVEYTFTEQQAEEIQPPTLSGYQVLQSIKIKDQVIDLNKTDQLLDEKLLFSGTIISNTSDIVQVSTIENPITSSLFEARENNGKMEIYLNEADAEPHWAGTYQLAVNLGSSQTYLKNTYLFDVTIFTEFEAPPAPEPKGDDELDKADFAEKVPDNVKEIEDALDKIEFTQDELGLELSENVTTETFDYDKPPVKEVIEVVQDEEEYLEVANAVITSFIPEDNTFIDYKQINEEMDIFSAKVEELKQKGTFNATKKLAKKKKFGLETKGFNKNSELEIGFTQPCIPPFDNGSPSTRGRGLLKMEEVNVAEEILDMQFELTSDVNPKDITYSLALTEFSSTNMKIKVDFDNPLLISQGYSQDKMKIKFHERGMRYFVSAESGEPMNIKEAKASSKQTTMPKQLPKGVNENEFRASAATQTNAMTSIVFVQLFLQIFMKGSLDYLWSLFFSLQLIRALNMYQMATPSNVEIYIDEVKKFVDFEMLKPDFLLTLALKEKVTMADIIDRIMGKKQEKLLEKETPSHLGSFGIEDGGILMNIIPYIMITGCFLVFLMCIALLVIIKKYRKQMKRKLKQIYHKFVWNGMVRSLSISYLTLCINVSAQLQIQRDVGKIDESTMMACMGITSYLIGYPLVISLYLRIHREELLKEEFVNKVGLLYKGLNVHRNFSAIYFYPVFYFKRFLFILIPFILPNYSGQQLMVLMLLTQGYLIWYCSVMPHQERWAKNLELCNEFFMLLLLYHNITFTNFNIDVNAQFLMGYSYLGILALMISANIATIGIFVTSSLKRKFRLKRLKKSAVKSLEEKNKRSYTEVEIDNIFAHHQKITLKNTRFDTPARPIFRGEKQPLNMKKLVPKKTKEVARRNASPIHLTTKKNPRNSKTPVFTDMSVIKENSIEDSDDYDKTLLTIFFQSGVDINKYNRRQEQKLIKKADEEELEDIKEEVLPLAAIRPEPEPDDLDK